MATPKRPDHNAEPLSWSHDTNDPAAVTTELTKPFPKEALEVKEGFTYVKYPDMIRRLIRSTGNRFSIRLVGQASEPFGKTGKGQERVLLRAWVELDIPVLGSARTHEGVQIAFVGTGEDMYKGAISDGIKKAAQSFGVGIELTGADAEWYIAQREHATQQATPPPPTPIRASEPEPDAFKRSPQGVKDNAALHAEFEHDQLRAWAKFKGFPGYSDVPDDLIHTLRQQVKDPKAKSSFHRQFPHKEAVNA